MLAGVARKVGRMGRSRVSYGGCLCQETGLKGKLVSHFKLAVGMVGGGVRELVYDADRPAFLKRELVGFGVNRYR